jgi:acyl-CoA synthetase (AMP-forming)/AMP-acid ligase II
MSRTLLDLFPPEYDRRTALCLPDTGTRLTYSALRDEVLRLADALAGAGVGRGDRVSMALPNGLAAIVGFLGASAVGTAAPLNPAYREEEFRFFLEDTNARVLLVPAGAAEDARRAATGRVPVLDVETSGATVRLPPGAVRRDAPRSTAGDVALVLHTSGSTGRPKRVPLTHANLVASIDNIAATYALSADDVTLCVMPLFHVHGLMASLMATLATGGTAVIPSKFSPLAFWRIAREHGATWYSAVPTIHQLLLARAEPGARPDGAERLRFIRSCSAALPPAVMSDLEAAFGAPVLEAYGMTEASHQMASNPLPPGTRRAGSVGPGTGVRIAILDEAGRELGPGERGEVAIRGDNVMNGYEGNPDANATAFSNGWFRTGDQGFLEPDGYLTLVARLKELINRGGEKISPREIDEVLLAHPSVAEAVCFGVAHPGWGEEVAAAVVLSAPATEAELIAFCKQRLADFKRPKQIFIADAIPRTATGKIQRRVVAQAFSASAP